MKINSDTNLDVLLAKYLSGEASPGEAMQVDDWLQDPQNKDTFNKIEKIWNIHEKPTPFRLVKPEAEWAHFKERFSGKEKRHRTTFSKIRYAVAASVIAAIVSGAIILLTLRSGSSKSAAYVKLESGQNISRDTLPDGSVIVLNRNAAIKYEKEFNKSERRLALNGESYFIVKPDREKPFIISAGEVKIEVVGTRFNVKEKKDLQLTEVQVQSGIVKMYTGTGGIFVHKGQTGICSGRALTVSNHIDNNSLSYATRDLVFNDMPLSEILVSLENAFAVTVTTDNKKLLQCRITADFHNESITYVMDVIAATLGLTYTIQESKINLKGHGCK